MWLTVSVEPGFIWPTKPLKFALYPTVQVIEFFVVQIIDLIHAILQVD